jgi:hypothetical protein
MARTVPPAVDRLRLRLDALASRSGFVAKRVFSTGKYHILSWTRESWRRDELRFGWRALPSSRSCFIDAQWSVVVDDRDLIASGLNVSYARRRVPYLTRPLPLPVVGGLLEAWWIAAVVADAAYAYNWLACSSSRTGAIDDLQRPDRNGPARESEAYRLIERAVLNGAPQ